MGSIAEKIGCSAEALRKWVRQAEVESGRRGGLTSDERSRMKELEREVRELRRANEILKKASGLAGVELLAQRRGPGCAGAGAPCAPGCR